MWLYLKNVVEDRIWAYEVEDMMTDSKYYRFRIDFMDDMPDGEYVYSLVEGVAVLSKGLLRIGDYKPITKVYENTSKTKQYRY